MFKSYWISSSISAQSEVNRLKARLRELEHENRRLKSERDYLQRSLDDAISRLNQIVGDRVDIIRAALSDKDVSHGD